jgi:hypothetical protein
MITQESKFGANYGVWNNNVIKTKSQLTDIWNKAQQAPEVQEAKKYKTAEEYVKAHSLYHGTLNELEGGVLKFGGGSQLKKGGYMGGHFLTDTPEIADIFSFGGKVYQAPGEIKNKVLDVNKNKKLFQDYIGKSYLSDGEKLTFTQQDFDSMFPNGKADWATINTDLAEQLSKKLGKIGVAIPEYAGGKQGMTYQIFQDNIPVKTKSQLISEWNKAQPPKVKITPPPLTEKAFSTHYERVKDQYGFTGGVEFTKKTELVEKKKAFDFIQRNPEKALRAGYGFDSIPENINPQVFRASLVASLNAGGKTAVAQEVAKLQSLKMTEAAQTMAFGRLDIGEEARVIKNVTQGRLERIGKQLGESKPEKQVEAAKESIKKQAKKAAEDVRSKMKPKNAVEELKKIDDLINDIIC